MPYCTMNYEFLYIGQIVYLPYTPFFDVPANTIGIITAIDSTNQRGMPIVAYFNGKVGLAPYHLKEKEITFLNAYNNQA